MTDSIVFIIGAYHHLLDVQSIITNTGHCESIVIFHPDSLESHVVESSMGIHCTTIQFRDLALPDLFFSRSALKEQKKTFSTVQGCTIYHSQYLNIANLLLHVLAKETTYRLLDEGSASFAVIERRKKAFFDRFRCSVYGLLTLTYFSYPSSITYYSKYVLPVGPSDTLEPVKQEISHLSHKPASISIILGSSMVTLGLIQSDQYCDAIIKEIGADRQEIFYAPHRKENTELLTEELKSKMTLLDSRDEPFEASFANGSIVPSRVYAVMPSTTLYNLKTRYSHNSTLVPIRLDDSAFSRNREMYSTLSHSMYEKISS